MRRRVGPLVGHAGCASNGAVQIKGDGCTPVVVSESSIVQYRPLLVSLTSMLGFVANLTLASGSPEVSWNFRPVLDPDGRRLPRVRAIVEGRDGAMWFGTWGSGVYVFDGTRWQTYDASSGLASNWVRCLAEDTDGAMWVGGGGGVSRIQSGSVETFTPKNVPQFPNDSVHYISQLRNGDLWISFDDGYIVAYRAGPGLRQGQDPWFRVANPTAFGETPVTVYDMAETSDGFIWCALEGDGMGRFEGGAWTICEEVEGMIDKLIQDRQGQLWAVGGNKIWRYDGDEWSLRVFDERIYCLCESGDGEVLAGTLTDVRSLRFDTNAPWVQSFRGTSSNPRFAVITVTRDGSRVWVGSNEGLVLGAKPPWVRYDGLGPNAFREGATFQPAPGKAPLCIDTRGHLAKFEEGQWKECCTIEYKSSFSCTSAPLAGFVWVLTKDNSVIRFSVDDCSISERIQVPEGAEPSRVFQSSDGRPWIYGKDGVWAHVESGWCRPRPGGARRKPTKMVRAAGNDFYVCYADSVECWREGHVIELATTDPPSSFYEFEGICLRRNGQLWITTSGAGVYAIQGGDRWQITKDDGLLHDTLGHIEESPDETVWVAYRWNGVGSYRDGRWVNFSYAQGFPDDHLLRIDATDSGEVWVTSLNQGLFRYVPDRAPPNTRFTAAPAALSPHGIGVFSFAGLDEWHRTGKEELVYSWRALSVDDEGSTAWSPFSTATTIATDSMKPGLYNFQVRAADFDRNVDPTPASTCVRVAAPFWARAVYIVPICLLTLLAATSLVLGYRKHLSLRRSEAALLVTNRQLEERIEEQRLAEAAKAKLEAQLLHSQKIEALGLVAGGVAHDFNNLLTVIFNYSDLMLHEHQLSPPDRLREYVGNIRQAADSAAGLTRQLLAFSRKQVFELQVLDLRQEITRAARLLRAMLSEDVEFHLSLADEQQNVRANSDQLTQVLVNLAMNARDAMPHGGKLRIESATTTVGANDPAARRNLPPGSYARVRVIDTGQGIAPDVLPLVLDPFFTTKGGGGTGLGLSTAFGIVTQFGGDLRLQSTVGVGTTVMIFLPLTESPVDVKSHVQPEHGPRPASGTLLLVEDEDQVRSVLTGMLRSAGYRVLAAAGPDAARRLFKQEGTIDLLVTDVVMPGTNGFDLARELESQRPEMRVLFVSGYTADVADRFGGLPQAANFLQKPFLPNELLRKVRRVLAD